MYLSRRINPDKLGGQNLCFLNFLFCILLDSEKPDKQGIYKAQIMKSKFQSGWDLEDDLFSLYGICGVKTGPVQTPPFSLGTLSLKPSPVFIGSSRRLDEDGVKPVKQGPACFAMEVLVVL